jgi:hypothetical protein
MMNEREYADEKAKKLVDLAMNMVQRGQEVANVSIVLMTASNNFLRAGEIGLAVEALCLSCSDPYSEVKKIPKDHHDAL